jgi:hypothetical protein
MPGKGLKKMETVRGPVKRLVLSEAAENECRYYTTSRLVRLPSRSGDNASSPSSLAPYSRMACHVKDNLQKKRQ